MFKSVKAENLYSVEEEQQKIIDHMNKVQLARGEKKKKSLICVCWGCGFGVPKLLRSEHCTE